MFANFSIFLQNSLDICSKINKNIPMSEKNARLNKIISVVQHENSSMPVIINIPPPPQTGK